MQAYALPGGKPKLKWKSTGPGTSTIPPSITNISSLTAATIAETSRGRATSQTTLPGCKMLRADDIMDGARHSQDQLRLRQNIHFRADDQFGISVWTLSLSRNSSSLSCLRPIRYKPFHVICQQFGTDLSDRAGRSHHSGGCASERDIHERAASRMASTAMMTVYESPVVTGTSSAFAIVMPASPTTEVNAPKPKICAPSFSASLPGLDNLTINRPLRQLHHPFWRIRAGDEPALDFLACRSERMPSISEIYTGGKNVEKKSICFSLSTRPKSGNFRLTSRFGSMGWMINAKVSTSLP